MLLASCGTLLQVDEYGTVERDAGLDAAAIHDCGAFAWADDCAICMRQSCCDEGSQCRTDANCSETFDCFAACAADDPTCRGGCFDHAKTPAEGRFLGCATRSCAAKCLTCSDLMPGFEAHSAEGGPKSSCATCIQQHACPDACLNDALCAGYFACLEETCPAWEQAPGCRISCGARNPGYITSLGGVNIAPCTEACGWGSYWDCLPTSELPLSAGTPAASKTELYAYVYRTTVPAPHMTVRACDILTNTCGTPSDTDDTGLANLSIDRTTGGDGFGMYFEIQGSPGREILYPGRPWIADKDQILLLIPTLDDPFAASWPPDVGSVVVYMADCSGALDMVTRDIGTTFVLEPESQDGGSSTSAYDPTYFLVYQDEDRTLKSGQSAAFDLVPTGSYRLLGRSPDGREVLRARILVQSATLTVVYANAPSFFLQP